MQASTRHVLIAVWSLVLSATAADFADNFDSYASGSQIHGQGIWQGWDNVPGAGALVSSALSLSGPNSVCITGASDLVGQFQGISGGQWSFSISQYVPDTSTGTNYVILLSRYAAGGNNNYWNLQIRNDMDAGVVISDFGFKTLPLVRNAWTEFRFEIDFRARTVAEFYNGTLLSSRAWQGGEPAIAALDFYANNAGPVYYDNLAIATNYGLAQAPAYYAPAQGLSGAPLRAALHQIIDNHRVIPYSSTAFDTSDAVEVLDQDPANPYNVWLLHAQRSEPKSTFGLTTGWSREYQWPNSYGLDDVHPSYSDLHNLRAEDADVNSVRGDKYYDVSDPADSGYRNPAHVEAPLCTADSDSWEPPAAVKGDIARSLFYMAVRYTGDVAGEPALYLTDAVGQINSTTNLMGRLSTLLEWHRADPVSSQEKLRNDRIYSLYQTNRNPFVDHPEWINLTFAPVHTNPPVLHVLRAVPLTLAWLATNQAPYILEVQFDVGAAWAPATNTFSD